MIVVNCINDMTPQYKEELVARLSTHIVDEVEDMFENIGLEADEYADYVESTLAYLDNNLSIFIK